MKHNNKVILSATLASLLSSGLAFAANGTVGDELSDVNQTENVVVHNPAGGYMSVTRNRVDPDKKVMTSSESSYATSVNELQDGAITGGQMSNWQGGGGGHGGGGIIIGGGHTIGATSPAPVEGGGNTGTQVGDQTDNGSNTSQDATNIQ